MSATARRSVETAAIAADGVTVFARGRGLPRALLDDVDLAVAGGEFVVLGGPNGAGKSTLLRVLAGELPPASGAVWFGGRPLVSQSPLEIARHRAVLTQHPATAFPFLGRAVVALGRSPWCGGVGGGGGSRDDTAAVDLSMRETGTTQLGRRLITTLSGGEAQRLHLARALAQLHGATDPRVLLLDEPTSSLDLGHQHAVLRLAREYAKAGCAVVCVLHDLNLAAQYADRLVLLADGVVAADGSPEQILNPALLRRLFAIDALVVPHPTLGFPVVIASGEASPECP
jgi:iron complex transport system ATP-binding protein